jgi:hypothetical protein
MAEAPGAGGGRGLRHRLGRRSAPGEEIGRWPIAGIPRILPSRPAGVNVGA